MTGQLLALVLFAIFVLGWRELDRFNNQPHERARREYRRASRDRRGF